MGTGLRPRTITIYPGTAAAESVETATMSFAAATMSFAAATMSFAAT
jgi:hypothetical protein